LRIPRSDRHCFRREHLTQYLDFRYYATRRRTVPVRKAIYTREQRRLVALLRSLREEAGLTQVELAKKLRRPQSFVSRFESGQRRVDLVELKEICGALGVGLVEFVRRFERG
jgi:ribosome-binding protein aMBF1 (putative translation factor)